MRSSPFEPGTVPQANENGSQHSSECSYRGGRLENEKES